MDNPFLRVEIKIDQNGGMEAGFGFGQPMPSEMATMIFRGAMQSATELIVAKLAEQAGNSGRPSIIVPQLDVRRLGINGKN